MGVDGLTHPTLSSFAIEGANEIVRCGGVPSPASGRGAGGSVLGGLGAAFGALGRHGQEQVEGGA
jgi:hypothetical protein